MDEKSLSAVALLDALLSSQARLYGFAFGLYNRRLPFIKTANAGQTRLYYGSQPNAPPEDTESGARRIASVGTANVSAYTVLRSGNLIEWELFVRWNSEHWAVNAQVSYTDEENDENPYEIIETIATYQTHSFEECVKYIEQATNFLIDEDEALRILNLYQQK